MPIPRPTNLRNLLLLAAIAAFPALGAAQVGNPSGGLDVLGGVGLDAPQDTASSAEVGGEFVLEDARVHRFFALDPFLFLPLDTGLADYHRRDPADHDRNGDAFHPRNFGDRANLGNLATPSQARVFHNHRRVGFDLAVDPWAPYLTSLDEQPFYRANQPYTQAKYNLGGGVEQVLDFRHVRNLFPNLNLSIDYTRYVSEGASRHQKAGVHDLGVSAWFRSRNRRYAATAGYVFGAIEQEENGGTDDANVFITTPRENATVRIDDAVATGRRQGFRWYHAWHFGDRDTISTTDSTFDLKTVPGVRLYHTLDWTFDRRGYLDPVPDSAFYGSMLLRDDSTIVDFGSQGYRQAVGIGNVVARERAGAIEQAKWRWYLQFVHRFDQPFGAVAGDGLHDGLVEARFSSHERGGTNWMLLDFEAAVDLEGEVLLSGRAGPAMFPHRAYAGISLQRSRPSRQEERFISNHAIWERSLRPEIRIVPEVAYRHRRFGMDIVARYHHIENFLYWDSTATPRRDRGTIGLVQLLVRQNFTFGRFHWDNAMAIQWTESELINLPVFRGKHSLYFEGKYFSGALYARFGVDIRYNTPYYADAWNPAVQHFHLQHAAKLATYPVADLFLAARIQTARIYLVGYNLTQGLLEPGYYPTPGYPAQGLGVRLGVDWVFWL